MPFSTPQQPQVPSEDRQGMLPDVYSEPAQQVNMQATFPRPSSSPTAYPTNNPPNKYGQPHLSSRTRSSSKITRIGLTSAGLCIIAGSLLLVFVYLVGQGFLPAETTTTSNTQLSNTVKANQTATATHLSTPTPLPITPTPTLPGQSLLDTSVLASAFNEQTGQIIQQATDFRVNQKIYVILGLRSGGNSHAVCLDWYLNDQAVNKFAFEVNPASNFHYYSYTTMPTTGSGRVEISLASTTACADAIMARKLRFTVSA
jgi:hypothetical protein